MIKFISILFIAFACESLYAQDTGDVADSARSYQMPSITVTSTKADEMTPVPFVVIGKSEIEKTYTTQDIPAYLAGQPSMIFYSESGNGIGYSNLTMRGFNQRRIAVMINGIPQNDPEDHNVYWIDFPDLTSNLESIEVQRGAGLINYGSAAIGGSINLTTSNYASRKGILISGGTGFQQFGDKLKLNVNKQSIEFSSGLTDNYAFYGRLSRIYSGGYRDRSWTDLNSYFFSAARFDEKVITQINIFGGPITDGLAYSGSPKSWTSDLSLRRQNLAWWSYDSTGKNVEYLQPRSIAETERFSQPHFEVLNNIELSDSIHLLSSAFYYQGDGYFDYDGSWADTTMLRITSSQGFSPKQNPTGTIIRGDVANKHGGWIPRLLINHNSGELLVGGEIRMHRSEHTGKIMSANGLPDDYDSQFKIYSYRGIRDIYSLFAREKYFLSDNFMAYAELQYAHQNYAIDREKAGNLDVQYKSVGGETAGNGGEIFNIAYNFLNPRLGANYSVNLENSIYAFAALTNREPRMRNLYAADDSYFGSQPLFEGRILQDGSVAYDFSKPITKPEQMIDIELGWNYRSEKLFLNANFYWMNYHNELVKSGQVDIFGNPIEGNAERTRHYGAELSASFRNISTPVGIFDISANLTISQNKIIEYQWAISKDTIGKVNSISLANNDISGFPAIMGNVSLNYTIKGFSLSLIFSSVGSFRTDNFGDMLTTSNELRSFLGSGYYADNRLDAYNVLNLHASYLLNDVLTLKSLRFRLMVNNVINSLYNAGGEGKDFFPAAERNAYFGIELGL